MWLCYLAIHSHLDTFRAIASGKATTMGHIQRHHLSDAEQAVPCNDILNLMDQLFKPMFERIIASRIESKTLRDIRIAVLSYMVFEDRENWEDTMILLHGTVTSTTLALAAALLGRFTMLRLRRRMRR